MGGGSPVGWDRGPILLPESLWSAPWGKLLDLSVCWCPQFSCVIPPLNTCAHGGTGTQLKEQEGQ